MAEFYDSLNEKLKTFISKQHMFFTASAAATGRVNVSPKGIDTLRVIDDHTVVYLDLTGSGNETAAHIENDGRVTIMMCSFDAKPWILRIYGRGEVIRKRHERWAEYKRLFETYPGERQIIVLHVESVQTSCGYAVPRYTYEGQRDTLLKWAENRGPEGVLEYWTEKSQASIDGFPTKLLAE